MEPEPLLPKHGGYRGLKSFQIAQLCYDVMVRFCDRYIEKRSRTHDQMVQAARSGVRNIAEGSKASGTSKKTELKLTNVARASLEELRLDYEDYLRHRGLPLWANDDPRRAALVARRCTTADAVAAWVRETHGPDRPSPCAARRVPRRARRSHLARAPTSVAPLRDSAGETERGRRRSGRYPRGREPLRVRWPRLEAVGSPRPRDRPAKTPIRGTGAARHASRRRSCPSRAA